MTTIVTKAVISASSKNALKSGIYANKLLEGEDPEQLQNTIDGLVQDFNVTNTIGYQLAQELAQVMLRMTRAERWRATLIAAHLAKHSTRVEFSHQLNLSVLSAASLPDWYFNDSQVDRGRAQSIYNAYIDLEYLIKNHSADRMMRVKAELPDLWVFVMGKSEATEKVYTFPERLSRYSSKTDPVMRLKDLQNHMGEKHRHEILWAQSEDRYEAVLDGLRAQVQMELAGNPNLQRDETSLHRRKTDLIGQLIQISRESQTVQLSASQSKADSAQVITYKQTGQGATAPEYQGHTLTADDNSKSQQPQQPQPKARDA
jgi:hypothetical protein